MVYGNKYSNISTIQWRPSTFASAMIWDSLTFLEISTMLSLKSVKELVKRIAKKNNLEGLSDLEALLGNVMEEMVENLLDFEMAEHLGYEKYERNSSNNARNRTSKKTIKTSIGEIPLDIPRDRNAEFKHKIVKKKILGMWVGDGAEGAKFWMSIFSELKIS